MPAPRFLPLLCAILFFSSLPAPAQEASSLAAANTSPLGEALVEEGFHAAEAQRTPHGNHLLVRVEANGTPFLLLIDTGSPVTLLFRSAAEKAGIGAAPDEGRLFPPLFSGINGPADTRPERARITRFRLGGVTLSPPPIYIVSSRGGRVRAGAGAELIDGILGLDALRQLRAVFGCRPAFFFFHPEREKARRLKSLLQGEGFSLVALAHQDGNYIVPLRLNGTRARMMLDTGSTFTLVDEALARRVKIVETPDRAYLVGLDGGLMPAKGISPKSTTLGSLALPPMTIAECDLLCLHPPSVPGRAKLDGLLGFDFIGRFYPVIDAGNDRLYLAAPGVR